MTALFALEAQEPAPARDDLRARLARAERTVARLNRALVECYVAQAGRVSQRHAPTDTEIARLEEVRGANTIDALWRCVAWQHKHSRDRMTGAEARAHRDALEQEGVSAWWSAVDRDGDPVSRVVWADDREKYAVTEGLDLHDAVVRLVREAVK